MEFFSHPKHSQTNIHLLILSLVLFFPVLVSCDQQTTESAKELASEAKDEMASAAEEGAKELVSETKEAMGSVAEEVAATTEEATEMVKEVVAEADTSVETEAASQANETAASGDGEEKPYTISADGKVDWYTFNGYRRYHAECHVCHGPAGLGSSFAPNLTESVKTLGHAGFLTVVVNGREIVSNTENTKMPSFADNKNVMCYIGDIYAYLVARADGAVGTQRPDKEAKPEAAKERDNSCAG